ncbi:tetratricopeptide repeat protein [Streptomyces sp. p1417]|uniref:Tetratricopeptide repeat protein n=1 Tax=Streptomyces typhae TaxID=2681492 RepID=A0A6L6WRT7_9ACTN|nr:tetratricopeptide repeat protein [Streptomyces typhae]MVO84773.1 tetratricopeptide repeat protein [Streptomyces typhae]
METEETPQDGSAAAPTPGPSDRRAVLSSDVRIPRHRRTSRGQSGSRGSRRAFPGAPGPFRSPALRGAVVGTLVGCAVLGSVLMVQGRGEDPEPPALGPAGRAMAAVGAGTPAALADLGALIGEREAHLRAYPGDDDSWAVLGSAYVERGLRTADSGDYLKAEQALRTSLKARPEGNVQALTGLAALGNARHDFRAAKKWGEQAVRLAPRRWTAHAALLDTYRGLGDTKGVARALEKVRKLRSGAAVRVRTGTVFRDRGWREDAAAALADAAALAKTPAERAVCLYEVGQLSWERGEAADALRHYDAALAADPDHHPALAGKGRALAALGRTSEALRAYQGALARQPAPEYALELGELYEFLKLRPAARAQYDLLRTRVKQAGLGGVNDERVLGRYEADHGDPEAAVRRLTAEFKRHGSPENADALGWALHRNGDSKAGLKKVETAVKKGPRSAVFFYHRGEIERALERYGDARRHLSEALRINPHFSPLGVPAARKALEALGEPPEGGPSQVYAPPGEVPAPLPSPKPSGKPKPRASAD